jgi:hypothetical protein
MKIDRRSLTYISSIMVAFIVYKAVMVEQWVVASVVASVYLAFAFGVDKFVIDLKNKRVQIDDTDKE